MQFSRKKKSKKIPNKIISIVLVLIMILFVFFITKTNLFSIKNINVLMKNKLNCVSDNQLIEISAFKGKNLFLVNEKQIQEITKKYFCVKSIKISKVFPDKVEMTTLGREPFAKIMNLKDNHASISAFIENTASPSAEASADAFLIDDEGMAFSLDTQNLDIPEIFIYPEQTVLSLGYKFKENVFNSILKIFDKIKTLNLDAKTTLSVDDSLAEKKNIFIIFSNPKIVFNLKEKIESQTASLQLILEKAKIDSEDLDFIDLRFDKPVIRIAPKK